MRIILDTNIWISYLISNRLIKLDALLQENQLVVLFSQETIGEFLEVTQRPKFKKYFSAKEVEQLLSVLNPHVVFIEPTSDLHICRDPKDNFLLNLALDGQADFLVTGDQDLLIVKGIGKAQILTFNQFIEKLN